MARTGDPDSDRDADTAAVEGDTRGADDGAVSVARTTGRLLLYGGASLVVSGSALTWLFVDTVEETVTVTGLDAVARVHPAFNGVVTALLAAVLAPLALADTRSGLAAAASVGLLVAGLAGVYLVDPAIAYGGDTGRLASTVTTVGIGVHATVAGGLCATAGAVLSTTARSSAA